MDTPSHIFHAYDIRGLAETELSGELGYRLGRGFASFLASRGADFSRQKIVVGRDMRPTSASYQREVIRGLTEAGADAVDIGLVSTPLFNFACVFYPEHAGGIMVTASHNPAEYNGFKMTLGTGEAVGQGSGMEEIRDMVLSSEFRVQSSEFVGQISQKDVLPDYVSRLYSLVPSAGILPLSVAIDFGNGMGGAVLPRVLERLPVRTTFLYETPDGTFPNHEANPLKTETLRDLQKTVVETHADFGFALDGDADRIGLVDERGEVVPASYVAALIGREILRTHPGAHMLYDLRSSRSVPELWEAAGATTEMCRVGHAFIKKMMNEKNAAFASELSLHLYYHDLSNVESSDLSLLYLLELLSREKRPLSEIIAPLRRYAHSGEMNFEVADKDAAMRRVEDRFGPGARDVSHLDGVWMSFDWGWLNVRKSNTEPVLRLNVEARTPEEMEEKVREARGVIGD